MQSDGELCVSMCTFDACTSIKPSVNNYFSCVNIYILAIFIRRLIKLLFYEMYLNRNRVSSCISNLSMNPKLMFNKQQKKARKENS